MELLDERSLIELVYGGAILGGGGGGSIDAGLAVGRNALSRGAPRLARIDELAPHARLVTLSMVGSMSGMLKGDSVETHAVALMLLRAIEEKEFAGVISSEVGPTAVTYGWSESAETGIPVVDAPCNGRAHPLALMGSLGLHRHPAYHCSTAAVGGGTGQTEIKLSLKLNVAKASEIVRSLAASSGLSLAVARNPLPANYVRKHAAIGGLKYAQQAGRILLKEKVRGLTALLGALCRAMGGRVLGSGKIIFAELKERGGFSVGHILLRNDDGEGCIAVCNEFLAFQQNGKMLAAFPDLITAFDYETALPLGSPEIKPGMKVALLGVPRARLRLGSTMNDTALLRPLERLLNLQLEPDALDATAAAHAQCEEQPA